MDQPVWVPINTDSEDETKILPIIQHQQINYTIGYSSSFSKQFVFVIPEKIRIPFRECVPRTLSDDAFMGKNELYLTTKGSEVDYAYLVNMYPFACGEGEYWWISKCFWKDLDKGIIIDDKFSILNDLVCNDISDDAKFVIQKLIEQTLNIAIGLQIKNGKIQLHEQILLGLNEHQMLHDCMNQIIQIKGEINQQHNNCLSQINDILYQVVVNCKGNLLVVNFKGDNPVEKAMLSNLTSTYNHILLITPLQRPSQEMFFCKNIDDKHIDQFNNIQKQQEQKAALEDLSQLEQQLLDTQSNLSKASTEDRLQQGKQKKSKKQKRSQSVKSDEQAIQNTQKSGNDLNKEMCKVQSQLNNNLSNIELQQFNDLSQQICDEEMQAVAMQSSRVVDLLAKGSPVENGIKNYYIIQNSRLGNLQQSHCLFQEAQMLQPGDSLQLSATTQLYGVVPIITNVSSNQQSDDFSCIKMKQLDLQMQQQKLLNQLSSKQTQTLQNSTKSKNLQINNSTTVKQIINEKYQQVISSQSQKTSSEELPELQIDIEEDEVDDEMTFTQKSIIKDLQEMHERSKMIDQQQISHSNQRESEEKQLQSLYDDYNADQLKIPISDQQKMILDKYERKNYPKISSSEEISINIEEENDFPDESVNSLIMSKPITLKRYQNVYYSSYPHQSRGLSNLELQTQKISQNQTTQSITQESIEQKSQPQSQYQFQSNKQNTSYSQQEKINPMIVEPVQNQAILKVTDPYRDYNQENYQFYQQQAEIKNLEPPKRLHVNDLYKYRNLKLKTNQTKQQTNKDTFLALEEQGKQLQKINSQLDQIIEQQMQKLNNKDQALQNDINERLKLVNKLLEPHMNKQLNIQ